MNCYKCLTGGYSPEELVRHEVEQHGYPEQKPFDPPVIMEKSELARRIETARREEREACAKIADYEAAFWVGKLIRARSTADHPKAKIGLEAAMCAYEEYRVSQHNAVSLSIDEAYPGWRVELIFDEGRSPIERYGDTLQDAISRALEVARSTADGKQAEPAGPCKRKLWSEYSASPAGREEYELYEKATGTVPDSIILPIKEKP